MRPRPSPGDANPSPDERLVSGKREKFVPPNEEVALDVVDPASPDDARLRRIVDAAWSEQEPGTDTTADPLLEAAEREGRLLARIAQQDQEIARLRGRVERTETALAFALEQLALTGIHESRTNPPPARPTMKLPPALVEALERGEDEVPPTDT